MRIVLAADGSKFTKKALAFLINHETLAGEVGVGEVREIGARQREPGRLRSDRRKLADGVDFVSAEDCRCHGSLLSSRPRSTIVLRTSTSLRASLRAWPGA